MYLCVMRGVPGAGKSWKMEQCVSSIIERDKDKITHAIKVCSADLFWGPDYKFDPKWLGHAHDWCFSSFVEGVFHKDEYIFLDNTNVVLDHFKKYIEFAVKNGYQFTMIEPDTEWKYDAEKCFQENSHNVPLKTIERMLKSFESEQEVLGNLDLDLVNSYVRSAEVFKEA